MSYDQRILMFTSQVRSLSIFLTFFSAFPTLTAIAAPRLDGPISAMLRTSEGQVLVAGSFEEGSLYQLNPAGLIRTDFSPFSKDASISELVVLPNEKILASGYFDSPPNDLHCEGLRRIDINGNADASFCAEFGKGVNGKIEAMILQPDQKIILGGGFSTLRGMPVNGLVRMGSNSMDVDTAFQSQIEHAFPQKTTIKSLALQPDGKILLLGYFQRFFGRPSEGMGRLNADGSEDTAFSLTISTSFFVGFTPIIDENNVAGTDLFLTEVVAQPDGNILVAGELVVHDSASHVYKVRLIRLHSDGSLDIDFIRRVNAVGFDADINTLALLPDGKIVVGCNRPFVCLNPDGSINDEAFHVAHNSFLGAVSSILPLPDGKLLVGGYFNQYRGVRVPNLVRLNPDGTLDETFLIDSEP